MVKARRETASSGGMGPDQGHLTIEEVVALAEEGSPIDDETMVALASRAGGQDELIALIFDAALQILERPDSDEEIDRAQSRDFHRRFEAEMAKLHQSQRETRAAIEKLVNG